MSPQEIDAEILRDLAAEPSPSSLESTRMPKTYRANVGFLRHESRVTVEDESGVIRPLDPRNDLVNHSPDGLSWGYTGSGPAQCALAILADCLGPDEALRLYQPFKFRIIAGLDMEKGWVLHEEAIRATCELLRQERAARTTTGEI